MERDNPPRDELFAPELRVRPLLVGLVVVLAACSAGSTWAAVHFHQQASRLSGPAADHALAQPRFVGSAPPRFVGSAPPAAAVVVGRGTDSPTLSSHSYDVAVSGNLRATVYLTTLATDGGASTSGQLMVGGLVRGGEPGVTYQFTGGDCDVNSLLGTVWAQGVADANGTAFMAGEDRTLPKADNYTLEVDAPSAGSAAAPGPGIEGVFVLGQASRYAGEPCN